MHSKTLKSEIIKMKLIEALKNLGIYLFLVSIICSLLVGCGKLGIGKDKDDEPQYKTENKSFNVKLISPSINDVRDRKTYKQGDYLVDDQNRLLIRFPHILSHASRMLVGDVGTYEEKVYVRITISNGQNLEGAENSLKLCPLVRDWTFFSTWSEIEPFTNQKWGSAGGDFDSEGCVHPDSDSTEDEKTLLFDMTQWVQDWPIGREKNFGLILISDAAVSIKGDESGSFSPRIQWKESI